MPEKRKEAGADLFFDHADGLPVPVCDRVSWYEIEDNYVLSYAFSEERTRSVFFMLYGKLVKKTGMRNEMYNYSQKYHKNMNKMIDIKPQMF